MEVIFYVSEIDTRYQRGRETKNFPLCDYTFEREREEEELSKGSKIEFYSFYKIIQIGSTPLTLRKRPILNLLFQRFCIHALFRQYMKDI